MIGAVAAVVLVVSVVALSVLLFSWVWDRVVERWVWPWLTARRSDVPTVEVLEHWSRAEALEYIRSPIHRQRCSCRKYGQLRNVANIVDDETGEVWFHNGTQCAPARECIPDRAGERPCACGRRVLPAGCEYGLTWLPGGTTAIRHSPDLCEQVDDDDDW